MKVIQLSVQGNPNIGLYGFANNYFCILSSAFTSQQVADIGTVLQVPCYQLNLLNSSLIGAFLAGNSHCLLVPYLVEDDELAALQKIVTAANKKHEISMKIVVVHHRITALGNAVLCNNNGCLVSPGFSADIKKIIRQSLNVSLHPGMIADTDVVGASVVHNSTGAVVHMRATPEQLEEVQSLLSVPCVLGSANFGSPYVKTAVICNDHGMVIGSTSTGIEVENIYETLGFLGKDE